MEIYKIVFTGGPGGGKTTILKQVASELRENGYNVFIVPETARIFIENGIKPKPNDREYTLQFQDAILKEQLFKEQITEDFAKMETNQRKTIILYDRATIDNRAYLDSQKDFDMLLTNNNVSELELINKYDLVIHLVSLAATNKEMYVNDDERTESPEEALEKERKTANAWALHRNMKIVMPTETIEEKKEIVMSHIEDYIDQRKEINEYTIPISNEECAFILQNLDENNSKKFDITEYSLSVGSMRCRENHLSKIEYNGKISYIVEKYFENDNEKCCLEKEIIPKEEFKKYLNDYKVYKITKRTETIFVNNFLIHRLFQDKNNSKIIIENNRNKESLSKFKRKNLVNNQELW